MIFKDGKNKYFGGVIMNWHTIRERKLIRKYGGKPLVKYGYDGVISGRPVEVRDARKDNRYRIQKNVHENLVKNNGSYIFANRGKSVKISAKKVSKIMGNGKWFKDRKYPHKFVRRGDVF